MYKMKKTSTALSLICIITVMFISMISMRPLTVQAAGTTYYFSTSGSDSNDGLSTSAPKQTLSAATALAVAGNTILLKRGDEWYSNVNGLGFTWNFSGKSGTAGNIITVDAYGTGANPIISGAEKMTSGWVSDGTNLWKHQITGYTDVYRLFVNGLSKKEVALASLNADTLYAVSAGYLYIYSPTSPNTSTIVEAIPTNLGNQTIKLNNSNYITFRNLDLRGSSDWDIVDMKAPNSNITFDTNCFTRTQQTVMFIYPGSSGTNSNITITKNYMNRIWSLAENLSNADGGTDGLYIVGALLNSTISLNTIIDFNHSQIGLESTGSTQPGVIGNLIERNELYLVNANYGRGFGLTGIEGKVTNNTIRRNYIHDTKASNHLEGNNNSIYSNLFVNNDLSTVANKAVGNTVDFAPWDNIVSHDNLFVNNTIYDAEEAMLFITQYSPAQLGTGNVIKNNLLVKWQNLGNNEKGIYVGYPSNYPTIENNGIWNTSSSEVAVRYRSTNTNYTVSQADAAFSWMNNNIQQAPVFVDETSRNFRLQSTSPYISGGQVISAIPGMVDYDGNAYNATSPSIGAFQFIDNIAPTTTDNAPAGWVNQDTTVTLSESDSGSGVAATYYTVDGGTQQTGTSVALTTEGVHTLAYWSADKAGNIEAPHTATVKIDKTAPVSVASVSPAAPNGSNGWYTSDVTVSLSASDNLSGAAKTEYQVNNGAWITYTGSIPAFGEGTYTVGYRSTDQAGNIESIQTIAFKIDKTAPVLTVQLDNTRIWPANHEMVTVNATLNSNDAASDVASVVLTSITSNEPDSGQGDIGANIGTTAASFRLRAERAGSGTERTYIITYTATDKAGNKTVASAIVIVPHDQSGK